MAKWFGASAICINENNELLMVLQGKPEEKKTWFVPSGGKEQGETFRECCIREVSEETGYAVDIVEKIKVKRSVHDGLNIPFEVHYFSVKINGGARKIQDPDELIYDIRWKSAEKINNAELTFPEDRQFLMDFLKT